MIYADFSWLSIVGDHLSQISSFPGSHETVTPVVSTSAMSLPTQPEPSANHLVSKLQEQLFKLASQVEAERKEKVEALENVQNLKGRLNKIEHGGALEPLLDIVTEEVIPPTITDRILQFAFPVTSAIGITSPPMVSTSATFAFPSKTSPYGKTYDKLDFTFPPQTPSKHTSFDSTPHSQPPYDFTCCCSACRGDVIEL